MTKNKTLTISLIVSIVLIVLGVVMYSVFGGFNGDRATADKTLVTVTGDSLITIREDYRENLNDLCMDTLKKEGARVKNGRYLEKTDQGVFEYTLTGTYKDETLTAYVTALEKAIGDSSEELFGGVTSTISVAQHRQTNVEYYKYLWTFAIAAAVVVVLAFAYFAIRFNLGMGITMAIAGVHDVLLTLAVIALVRIPTGIGVAAVGAFALLLSLFLNGYVFGKMRRDFKSEEFKAYSSREAVAASQKTSRKPVFITAVVAVAMLVVMGVIGVITGFDLTSYMLCALVAVIVNTYSSLVLSPSIYAVFKEKADANKANKSRYDYDPDKKKQKDNQVHSVGEAKSEL